MVGSFIQQAMQTKMGITSGEFQRQILQVGLHFQWHSSYILLIQRWQANQPKRTAGFLVEHSARLSDLSITLLPCRMINSIASFIMDKSYFLKETHGYDNKKPCWSLLESAGRWGVINYRIAARLRDNIDRISLRLIQYILRNKLALRGNITISALLLLTRAKIIAIMRLRSGIKCYV